MKISFIIAAIIVAIAAYVGVGRQARIKTLETERQDLIGQGEALGIPTGLDENFSPERNVQRARQRDREDLVVGFIAELTSLMKEDGNEETPEMMARGEKLIATLSEFSAPELKMLVDKLVTDYSLGEDEKRDLTMFAVMMSLSESPMTALTMLSEGLESELIDLEKALGLLATAVPTLAREDPLAAAAWIRGNKEAVGEVGDALFSNVIEQAGSRDFRMALSIIDDLDSDKGRAFESLGMIVTTERADDFLDAIRGNGATSEEKLGAFRSLAKGQFVHDFEEATEWLANSKLNEDERGAFISNLRFHSIKENPGEWISWINARVAGSEAAADARKNASQQIITEWTENDFVAAGEWVGNLPPGESRDEAVTQYASNLAEYEPAAAADWAVTLPDGAAKSKVLHDVYEGYQRKSPEEAAAFAEKHGLEIPKSPAPTGAE